MVPNIVMENGMFGNKQTKLEIDKAEKVMNKRLEKLKSEGETMISVGDLVEGTFLEDFYGPWTKKEVGFSIGDGKEWIVVEGE